VLTIILNFVLPVALYVIVLRASQAHDAAVRRASFLAQSAGVISINDPDPQPQPPQTPPAQSRSFYRRMFGLLSPATVDRRLEAMSAAHTGDAEEPPHARLRHLLGAKPPPESPGAEPLLGAAAEDALFGHHAGDPLRTAAPPAGERDEIEDAELVPGVSAFVSPVVLAYAIGVFAVVLNVVTLALQIDGAVGP
jgi:hypothetical protein